MLVTAFMLVFASGLVSNSTAIFYQNTEQYLANAIGMSASVKPTELNTYTAALTAKERELDEREALLKEREISVGLSGGSAGADRTTYILASILFILLLLILLNYVLDYLRSKEALEVKTV
jgi:hypothetical protein